MRTTFSARARRRLGAAAAVVALTAVAAVTGSPAGAAPDAASGRDDAIPPAAAGTIRMTQANLLSGQPQAAFDADLAKVYAAQPDFVTFNEVPFRPDTSLAPPSYAPADGSAPIGYALWRAAPTGDDRIDRYTRATPVAWRTDRWAPQASGTVNISNSPGREPGSSTDLGIRYANWVTLRGAAGQVVSVVSIHVAPDGTYSRGLLGPSVANLANLTASLSQAGPVMVGGDFNVAYGSSAYASVPWASYGLTPTYDVTGTSFPTGDHYGNTIDYVFLDQASQFVVQGQYTSALNSDHNAVVADVALAFSPADQPAVFFPGTLVNTPLGGKVGRRGVLDAVVKAVDGAPEGGTVRLRSTSVTDKDLHQSLKRAVRRGVHVQVITGERRLTGKQLVLVRKLGSTITKREFIVSCTTSPACSTDARRGRSAALQLLVSRAGLTPDLRIDADQPAVNAKAKNLTTATLSTDSARYDAAVATFKRLSGRTTPRAAKQARARVVAHFHLRGGAQPDA